MRTITTCAGLGDSAWVLIRLQQSNERFHFKIPDSTPQRGHQIFDLVPHIAESCTYAPNLGYKRIEAGNITHTRNTWSKIKDNNFFLSANKHLEDGHRIEKFLPDLPVSYRLELDTKEFDRLEAERILPTGPNYIGIYTSAYGPQRNWGFWDEKKWFDLIRAIHTNGMVYVIIGASWDVDLSQKLMAIMDEKNIPYINTIGTQLSTVIEIQRRLKYAFYFPSGLPILSEMAGGSDSVMFMPFHLKKMVGTYVAPGRGDGFKEALFCEPEVIADWVLNKYCLLDKLEK